MAELSTYMVTQQRAGTRCCDTGCAVVVDHITGRTVCSCQLQKSLSSYLSRVPSLQLESLYGRIPTTNSTNVSKKESSLFHKHPKDRYSGTFLTTATRYSPTHGMTIHPHPYNAFYSGCDIHGSSRKNATSESTGALKAWLYQHRKNPYPSKGEKVMLAVISQMNMTQVSTWFANARRRLKKEKRMNEKETTLKDQDATDAESLEECNISSLSETDKDNSVKISNGPKICTYSSDLSDTEEWKSCETVSVKSCVNSLLSADVRHERFMERMLSPTVTDSKMSANSCRNKDTSNVKIENVEQSILNNGTTFNNKRMPVSKSVSATQENQTKPKIWSIADLIG